MEEENFLKMRGLKSFNMFKMLICAFVVLLGDLPLEKQLIIILLANNCFIINSIL
jgi:hypothetical protein